MTTMALFLNIKHIGLSIWDNSDSNSEDVSAVQKE